MIFKCRLNLNWPIFNLIYIKFISFLNRKAWVCRISLRPKIFRLIKHRAIYIPHLGILSRYDRGHLIFYRVHVSIMYLCPNSMMVYLYNVYENVHQTRKILLLVYILYVVCSAKTLVHRYYQSKIKDSRK